MNKELLYASWVAIIVTMMVTGCVDNGLEQEVESQPSDERIAFRQKIGNMTRGSSQAQEAGHYEFGVFAMKADALTTYSPSTNGVMHNYLVAYTNGTTSGINNWYQGIATSSTWGNAPSGTLTDGATGVSSWFYEDITPINHATYTTPEVNQILKYWDRVVDKHYFFAYMPYTKEAAAATTYNADKIAFSYDDTDGAKFVYSNLSSFYTSPVTGKQVATAAAKTDGVTPKTYTDNEILNDNEALYAYKEVAKAKYGEDVPLEFNHVNAKVNIAFYETIDNYKVKLIDIVPENTPAPGDDPDGVRVYLTAAKGVQFSPSTDIQAQQPMTKLQTTDLPTYYEAANVTATHVENPTATLSLAGKTLSSPLTPIDPVKKNLVFKATNATRTALPITGETQYIGEDNANKTYSSTTLYVLPNHDGTNYITDDDAKEYPTHGTLTTGGGTTVKVADKTGYTLHVSYEILPEDGTSKTTVYDARVHVDAEYCKWQAGKAYTYVFRITSMSNGTTDPLAVDPATSLTTQQPWVDPEDPRVPDEPALIPIIFDGVVVTDYESATIDKIIDADEYAVTEISSWATKTISTTDYRVGATPLTSARLTELMGTEWEIPTTSVINDVTYDAVNNKFTVKNGSTVLAEWRATEKDQVSSSGVTQQYNSTNITEDVPATVPSAAIYVWDNSGTATKYSTKPATVTYSTKTVVTTYKKGVETYVQIVVGHNGVDSPEVWTRNGMEWTADPAVTTQLTAGNGWTITTKTTYSGSTVTSWEPVTTTTGQSPTKAYAIVKHI